MSIRLFKANDYLTTNDSGIGANSLDTTGGAYFVSKVSGVVDKATNAVSIAGVNVTESTYASDNQTVALKAVNFTPADNNRLYEVAITNGTITIADEQKYFNLTASGGDTVDGTTESTTTGQLKMIKFNTATNSVFQIANK